MKGRKGSVHLWEDCDFRGTCKKPSTLRPKDSALLQDFSFDPCSTPDSERAQTTVIRVHGCLRRHTLAVPDSVVERQVRSSSAREDGKGAPSFPKLPRR